MKIFVRKNYKINNMRLWFHYYNQAMPYRKNSEIGFLSLLLHFLLSIPSSFFCVHLEPPFQLPTSMLADDNW